LGKVQSETTTTSFWFLVDERRSLDCVDAGDGHVRPVELIADEVVRLLGEFLYLRGGAAMISRLRQWCAHRLRKRLGFPLQELTLMRLKRSGFSPNVIFDVGASYGPFVDDVRVLWPDVFVHTFEPDPEYVEELMRRSKSDSRLVVCAALVGAGSSSGVEYNFHLGASSVLHSMPGLPRRVAPMITLDEYVRETGCTPDFLKIDVQGYELEVLKGAVQALNQIEVVLTEINHIAVYQDAPLAADLICWMRERDFALHDVCNLMPRPRDGALWQSDMLFVKHTSRIRDSCAWG
jgi:FkbM family methyltransferase